MLWGVTFYYDLRWNHHTAYCRDCLLDKVRKNKVVSYRIRDLFSDRLSKSDTMLSINLLGSCEKIRYFCYYSRVLR